MKQAILFTDGSCLGNPGPGGWAFVLRCGSLQQENWGMDAHTTNNRMELQAVIAGLSSLKAPCFVRVVTDSQYVQRAMTRHLSKWMTRSVFMSTKLGGRKDLIHDDAERWGLDPIN
jgi:ribonuclease HI